ncbi:hypothetical protein [Phenylobacterium montanum]|uniref:Uncharacterized protein n=1 Tax=Phenylobacterium montanum TaxID=2823693 RepID=A0A975G105_9CAUL|nr:hypothetical protein [Caulobacter sp. S6]QUD88497.1 hypothetical protein KCG34_00975 [Caulobacter sp. S6]
MTEADQLKAFREQWRAAGQPYALWGGRIIGIGLAFLVVVQILGMVQPTLLMRFGVLLMLACLVGIAIGWAMLVVAFFRRRRWVKENTPREPQPPEAL